MRRKRVPTNWPKDVYFIRAVGLDAIKIGYAADAGARLRSIDVCCPAPVEFVGVISTWEAERVEAEWHTRFHDLKIKGEWFRETPELVDAINEATKAAPNAGADALYEAMRKAYA